MADHSSNAEGAAMNASEKAAANRAARGYVAPAFVPKPKPDFAALRAKRDEALKAAVAAVAKDWGCDPSEISFHASPSGCYCACPNGPCEHEFAGCRVSDDGLLTEQVCRLCGMGALAHTLRYAP